MNQRVPPYVVCSLLVALLSGGCGTKEVDVDRASTGGSSLSRGNVVGDLRFHDFHSRIFGNMRKLRVWLPPGYDRPENRLRRYPVLFLNDGQNLFDPTTAILNPMEWHVDETLSSLIHSGELRPLIVVGIDNAGRRGRFKEYFPYFDKHLDPPEPNPRGTRYPGFLVDEVLPFIEARYRISQDENERGVGGSSAGALAAIYAVISRPGAFGRLLVESPSIYVDDYHVLKDGSSLGRWPERIYLGVGTNEAGHAECNPASAEESELVQDVKRFHRQLLGAGVEPSRVKLLVISCAGHNESAWAERLPVALTFLFAARS